MRKQKRQGIAVPQAVGLLLLLIGFLVCSYELLAHDRWEPITTAYAFFFGMLLLSEPAHEPRKKRSR